MDRLREDRFVHLLYLLVRDELPLGQVEKVVDKIARGEAHTPDETLLRWCEIQRDRLPVYQLEDPAADVVAGWRIDDLDDDLDAVPSIRS